VASAPDLSVVVPTFNRAAHLEPLLDALMRQQTGGITYEVIVVDNNSQDGTREIVKGVIARGTPVPLEYIHEPRQGVSYARNTGVQRARSSRIAFLDDDGVPVGTWVADISRAFDEHPEADCIGGRVHAVWRTPPPSWFRSDHAGPVALQDRPRPAYFDADHASACLLTANFACRREAFEAVGGFSPAYPRNQDREFELRLWRAGKRGLYLPTADVMVEIPPHRLTKAYHRRWQARTGHYHAVMRFRDMLDADGRLVPDGYYRTFLGVPRFLYRECLQHLRDWIWTALTRRADERFRHETRIWYYVSFFITRWASTWAARARPVKKARQLSSA